MGYARILATAVVAAAAFGVLVHCSLLTDTSGLSGGADDRDVATISDAPSEASPPPPPPDASADASGPLGPTWLAYGTNKGSIGVRHWDGVSSTFGPELAGPTLASASIVKWVIARDAVLGIVSVASSGTGTLDVFERDASGAWKTVFSVPAPDPTRRGFDIEVEHTGSVIVVYADTTPSPKARRRTTSGWSGDVALSPVGSLPIQWIELATSPTSDEMVLLAQDGGSNLLTWTAKAGAWTGGAELESYMPPAPFKSFDVAYDVSGGIVAVWGDTQAVVDGGEGNMYTAHKSAGSSTFDDKQLVMQNEPVGPMQLAREPMSNRMAFAALEHTCNPKGLGCDDFVLGVWTGTTWSPIAPIDIDTTTLYEGRRGSTPVSVAWLGNTGVAIGAYHRTLSSGDGLLAFARYADNKLGQMQAAPTTLRARASLELAGVDGPKVLALVLDVDGSLFAKAYAELGATASWTDADKGAALANDLSVLGRPFDLAH